MKATQKSKNVAVDTNRRAYQKPLVEKIQLVLEESVLGTPCKEAEDVGLCIDQSGIANQIIVPS